MKAIPVIIPDELDSESLEGDWSPVTVGGTVHFSKASITNQLKVLELRTLHRFHLH